MPVEHSSQKIDQQGRPVGDRLLQRHDGWATQARMEGKNPGPLDLGLCLARNNDRNCASFSMSSLSERGRL